MAGAAAKHLDVKLEPLLKTIRLLMFEICCISELPHTHRELRIPKLERFQQREAKHQFLAQPATNSKNTEHLAA
ncbi:MAG: hypothetical protein K8I00_13105, partial [Candidatus Omnitrophica bacterium]|nr:hypothetical protein [Candidatus Omnitrophota bacterium]